MPKRSLQSDAAAGRGSEAHQAPRGVSQSSATSAAVEMSAKMKFQDMFVFLPGLDLPPVLFYTFKYFSGWSRVVGRQLRQMW